jgi:hypothetical protein
MTTVKQIIELDSGDFVLESVDKQTVRVNPMHVIRVGETSDFGVMEIDPTLGCCENTISQFQFPDHDGAQLKKFVEQRVEIVANNSADHALKALRQIGKFL